MRYFEFCAGFEMNKMAVRRNGMLLWIISKFTFKSVNKLELSDIGLIALIFADTSIS